MQNREHSSNRDQLLKNLLPAGILKVSTLVFLWLVSISHLLAWHGSRCEMD
jgi:hypothetical protein